MVLGKQPEALICISSSFFWFFFGFFLFFGFFFGFFFVFDQAVTKRNFQLNIISVKVSGFQFRTSYGWKSSSEMLPIHFANQIIFNDLEIKILTSVAVTS